MCVCVCIYTKRMFHTLLWLTVTERRPRDQGDTTVPLHGLAGPRGALPRHGAAGLHPQGQVQDHDQRRAHGGPLQVCTHRPGPGAIRACIPKLVLYAGGLEYLNEGTRMFSVHYTSEEEIWGDNDIGRK